MKYIYQAWTVVLFLAIGGRTPALWADCFPAPAGLVAWWRAQGNAIDSAGTNNGALQNGVLFASGKVAQAFSFDGIGAFVQIADSPAFHPTAGVTMEAWIRATNPPSFAGIISKAEQSGSIRTGFKMSLDLQPRVRADFYKGLGFPDDYLSASHPATVDDQNWHHVVATYDGTTALVYVDGVAGPPATGTGYLTSSGLSLTIGKEQLQGGNFFHGLIDEPSIYNRALTAAEVQALFQAGSAGKCFFAIDWFEVAGGGGTSSDATRSLSGTIGQADAGGPLTNAQFSLVGGFWAVPIAVQVTGAPIIRIVPAGPGFAAISWAPPTPGFHLQVSDSLTSPNWSNAPSGTTNPITVPATLPQKFYRLIQP